ncbi:MAG: EAL domain-containing protein (putative c-di-GMP-specific phosphodiesterase class I) [Granulosicoccus sp.]|jgi:EAL domain-containing protein (putative c-di-GMP-specific phosphodiesterase class I)
MVSTINQLGHTVGAKTIAEFVEDDETMDQLKELQVDFAQGYGLKMPTPLDQLIDDLPLRALTASNDTIADITANTNIADITSINAFKKAS